MNSEAQRAKAATFARLHDAGCFILPNAWDVPSALLCLDAGFPAVGTTSVGVAFAHGLMDGEHIGSDLMLAAVGQIAARTPLPVSADLEAGYGSTPEAVAATVDAAVRRGLVGCNLEDRDPSTGTLFEASAAAERIRAARAAANAAGLDDFTINARTDPLFLGQEPREVALKQAIERGNLYLEAGARCVFVPGPGDSETARTLAREIAGPVNIMAGGSGQTDSLARLAEAGVRRISLGGLLFASAYGACRRALADIAWTGDFEAAQKARPDFVQVMRLLALHA